MDQAAGVANEDSRVHVLILILVVHLVLIEIREVVLRDCTQQSCSKVSSRQRGRVDREGGACSQSFSSSESGSWLASWSM